MARSNAAIPIDAPKLPPVTALKALPRVGRFLGPYKRMVVFASSALTFAAASVLAIGQGVKVGVDRGFAAGNAPELDRTLALMHAWLVFRAAATYPHLYHPSI